MNKKVLILASLVWANALPCQSGDGFNNGGGLAEQNFAFSWVTLSDVLENCLYSGACVLSSKQFEALQKLSELLPAEQRGKGLVFKSASKYPQYFKLNSNGDFPVAFTTDEIGSPIYVNQDVIYPTTFDGMTRPMTVAEATQVIVSELGRRLNLNSEVREDLGAIVGESEELLLEGIHLERFERPEIRVILYRGTDTRLLLDVEKAWVDLGELLLKEIPCQVKPGDLVLNNLHWESFPQWNRNEKSQVLPFASGVKVVCDGKSYRGIVRFGVTFKVDSANWQNDSKLKMTFEKGSVSVRLEGMHQVRGDQ